ncbi:hypothetical protein [Ascidiimonas sp. W6]|uniref:hypothetical protein n=1 Tax=Ascidiimonas meishanensis TaxID=3128903 RepID=UPI0030EEFA1C
MSTDKPKEGKTAAMASYITIIGCIIAIFMNMESKNAFARFHIRQAFGIHIAFYGIGVLISQFDSWLISASFYLFFIVLWVYGFSGAIQERKTSIPMLGPLFQSWFKFIK